MNSRDAREIDIDEEEARFGRSVHIVSNSETELGNDGLPWPQTFDAQVWAKKFIRTVSANPEIASDEGTMIGWFANAIMIGYDRGRSEIKNSSS